MKKRCLLMMVLFIFLSTLGCGSEKKSADSKYRIHLIHFTELTVSNFEDKIKKGMSSLGLKEGKDYEIRKISAQNDIATLNSIIDASKNDKPDVIVTFHAQTLYAAINRIKDTPIIFSILTNPYILGAGKSESEHLSNVTGLYYVPPTEALLEAVSKCQPKIKKLGIVFQIGDLESCFQKENAKKIAQTYNIEVEAVGFTTVTEIKESVDTLANKGVDGILMNYDSYYDMVYPLLTRRSQDRKIPLFAYGHNKEGAVIVASRHTVNADKYFADVITKLRNGEKPGNIAFASNMAGNVDFYINSKRAKELGMIIPEGLAKGSTQTGK